MPDTPHTQTHARTHTDLARMHAHTHTDLARTHAHTRTQINNHTCALISTDFCAFTCVCACEIGNVCVWAYGCNMYVCKRDGQRVCVSIWV